MDTARASRPSIPPPSSSGMCPGCGKPVDTLRAGHVAILSGRFHYFCDLACKQSFASTRAPASTFAPHELETQEPPPVLFLESGPRRAPARTPTPTPLEALDVGVPAVRFPDVEPIEEVRPLPRLAITNEAEPTANDFVRETLPPPAVAE